jgi:hypothetical protein
VTDTRKLDELEAEARQHRRQRAEATTQAARVYHARIIAAIEESIAAERGRK